MDNIAQYASASHLLALLVGVAVGVAATMFVGSAIDKMFDVDERLG